MKKALSAVVLFVSLAPAFCADPYGIDRRESGEPRLGNRFPARMDDISKDTGLPALLSQTGVFEPFKTTGPLVATRAMIPYGVNTPLWSDGAFKSRWLYVPKDGAITFSQDGGWKFPPGSVFIKHFDLLVNDATGDKKRIETRVLVADDTGKNTIYAVTYKWNAAQTDATLVGAEAPPDDVFAITSTNGNRNQTWRYPRRGDAKDGKAGCATCHSAGVGVGGTLGVIGLKTAQLNGSFIYPPKPNQATGIEDNQLRTLNKIGLFSGAPDLDTAVLQNGTKTIASQPQMAQFGNGTDNPAFTKELKVRSYLDVNCAICHGYRGTSPSLKFTRDFNQLKAPAGTHVKFYSVDKLADAVAAEDEIYARVAIGSMPKGSVKTISDPQLLPLLRDYITMSFNLVRVAPLAVNKITLVFNSIPDNTATVPGNYKLWQKSDKNQTAIVLKPNPVVNGSNVTFDLVNGMAPNVEHQLSVIGTVTDSSNPQNTAWKNKIVEFRAPPAPGPHPNVDDGSPPANDNFSSAIILTGAAAADTNFNCYASKEAGEPNHANNSGSNSVWWVWTAPSNGPVQVDTFGSDFDTLLAVYTGTSVSALTPVGSDNDAEDEDLAPGADAGTGFLRFNAIVGQTYYIAVDGQNDGYFAQCGNIALHLHPAAPVPQGPVNDFFTNAIVLSGSGGSINWSNTFATKENGELDHAGDPGGASVWWQWTAPSDGQFSLDTHGSLFDTLLGVYMGTGVSNLTQVTENDNDSGLLTSSVQFSAASGTTYYIAVDGYAGSSGNIVLNYSFVPAPAPILPNVQSVPSFAALPANNGAFPLQIDGPAGAVVEVQVSDNLTNWTSAGIQTLTGAPWVFADPLLSDRTHRYYRVVRHLQSKPAP